MLLSDIFTDLAYGELSQLFTGEPDSSEIDEVYYPKIISFVNLGLMDLYKKFLIKESEIIIQMYPDITEYKLLIDYAVTNTTSTEPVKYILDTAANPFIGDVLQIEEVFNELGKECPLNDVNNENSLFTPWDTTLQIPTPVENETVSVIYRAKPDKLSIHNMDPAATTIELPEQLETALLAYIGHRAHIALPQGENSAAAAFFSKYRGICDEVTLLGTLNKNTPSNLRIENNGWV